jgi:hypothetical protein
MKILSTLEEKFLFPFSRILSLCLAMILSIVLIIGLLYLFFFNNVNSKNNVSIQEIKFALNPTEQTELSDQKITIPENVKQAFTGENLKILNLWLASFNDNQKQDFIDNLSSIINQAAKENINLNSPAGEKELYNIINKYKDMKMEKIKSDAFGIDSMMQYLTKAFIGMSLFLILLSFLMVILILLNIKIENNTRVKQSD